MAIPYHHSEKGFFIPPLSSEGESINVTCKPFSCNPQLAFLFYSHQHDKLRSVNPRSFVASCLRSSDTIQRIGESSRRCSCSFFIYLTPVGEGMGSGRLVESRRRS